MMEGHVEEEAVCLKADRKQKQRKALRYRYNLQKHVTSNLLPLVRCYLLK
jgi:hypothetical protein